MANNILSSVLSSTKFRLFNQMLNSVAIPKIKIIKVSLKYSARNLRHKLEDGSYKVDARIILPMEVEVSAICPDLDTQTQVREILVDNTSFYTLTTKGMSIRNLMSNNEGIKQSPDMLSSTPTTLRFKQVLVYGTLPPVARQPADSTVIDHGFFSISAATKSVSNLYSSVKSYASSALSSFQ